MRKSFIALAAAVATLGLVAQGGTANALLLKDRSPSVTAAQLVVGLGTTGAYWALARSHHHAHVWHHHNHKKFHFNARWWGLTTVGCMALTPILGAALVGHFEKRELRSSEVFMMGADCIVPILGGWVAKAAFDANPQWDRGTGGPVR